MNSMVDRRSTWGNIDWMTFGLFMLLLAIGWLAVYAAGYDFQDRGVSFFSHVYGRQLIWIGISAVIGLMVLITDSKFYTAFAYVIFGLVVLTLLTTFAFPPVKGSRSWITFGSFQFQPAELAKFATLLALSKYLSGLTVNFKSWKTWCVASAIFLLPMAVVIAQNETGSALVFGVFFLVLYRFGFPGWILLTGVLMGVLALLALLVNPYIIIGVLLVLTAASAYLLRRQMTAVYMIVGVFVLSSGFVWATDYVFDNVLGAHQQQRIDVFLGRDVEVKDADYNVRQSKIAIGSGGLLGKGFLQGTFTKFNFVPEQTTDFIFCTIGEEYGFWGSTLLLLIYLGFLLRIIHIGERQRSRFSRVYAYGVACILFFHLLINVGMTMGLMPIIGIPLPLISYGGSSLLGVTILVFILIKLDADRLSVLR
ncbi:MAG TPA: rod shape-determining protein RodA [Chitinophagales bacterium]|nr:rod shape-determining protein RodA [Chitinophagales bacterium]